MKKVFVLALIFCCFFVSCTTFHATIEGLDKAEIILENGKKD